MSGLRASRSPGGSRLLMIGLFALVLVAGCGVQVLQRTLLTPDEWLTKRPSPGREAAPPAFLKAHLRDGRAVILSAWTWDPVTRRVSGTGRSLDVNRNETATGPRSVPIDSVALFETNVVGRSSGPIAALSIMTGLSLAATIYCITDPKACFGSCPTFYVFDGERDLLQAEGFSASVSPSLEATDVDALYRARVRGDTLTVTMRNEALETHVVRHADLLVAPRGPAGRVFAVVGGGFSAAGDPRAPVRATAEEGDCLDALRAFDGHERCSAADSLDLAAREEIALEFAPADTGRWGLVLASRQTLMTTYLFYQALSAMGRSAGAWLAALERGDATTQARSRAMGDELGGIEVEVRGPDGAWRAAGLTRETGPLATDVRLLALPPLPAGPVSVRLRMTRGAWRLDWAALARLNGTVEPRRVPPARVRRNGRDEPEALAALRDPERALTTLPGDTYELLYALPPAIAARPTELFLESRGYYLEWMRDEWLAGENPALAALMVTQPHIALRLLAPAYKSAEPQMETLFWESRYVRP